MTKNRKNRSWILIFINTNKHRIHISKKKKKSPAKTLFRLFNLLQKFTDVSSSATEWEIPMTT